jgi:hypothetical protein
MFPSFNGIDITPTGIIPDASDWVMRFVAIQNLINSLF